MPCPITLKKCRRITFGLVLIVFLFALISSRIPDPKFHNMEILRFILNDTSMRNPITQDQPYNIIMQPQITCDDDFNTSDSHHFIIIVNSALRHFANREDIRETWGQETYRKKNKFKIIFTIAYNDTSDTDQAQVKREASKYKDLLVLRGSENYHKMGEKVLTSFQWVINSCKSNFQYIIKTDDDMFIDSNRLFKLIHNGVAANQGDDIIMCAYFANDLVPRDPKSKWYISKRNWPFDRWPKFCRGSMYVIPIQLIKAMLTEWPRMKTCFNVWHEDVFITGLLPLRSNVKFIDWNKFYVNLDELDVDKYFTKDIIFAHAPNLTMRASLLHNLYKI